MTEKLQVFDILIMDKSIALADGRDDQWVIAVRDHREPNLERTQARYRQNGYHTKRKPVEWGSTGTKVDYMFTNGIWVSPVWRDERFWRYRPNYHLAHVSESNPSMIAHYASQEHYDAGRLTIMKPGKYLKKYFGQDSRSPLTDQQVAYMSEWFATGSKPPPQIEDHVFKITGDDATEAAIAYIDGPRSCMSGYHFKEVENHPALIYGDPGDLRLAIIESKERKGRGGRAKVIARAVCCPKLKAFGRIYPTADHWSEDGFATHADSVAVNQRLMAYLKEKGWTSIYEVKGAMDGAIIPAKRIRSMYYRMPYLDNFCIDVGDKDPDTSAILNFVVNQTSGRLGGGGTNGVASFGDHPDNAPGTNAYPTHRDGGDDDDDEPEYDWTCDSCDDGFDNDEESWTVFTRYSQGGAQTWCATCRDDGAFFCEGSQDYYADMVDSVTVVDARFESNWFESHGGYICDGTGEAFFEEQEPKFEMWDGETWSKTHFDEHGYTDPETGDHLPLAGMFEWSFYPLGEQETAYKDLHNREQAQRNYGPTGPDYVRAIPDPYHRENRTYVHQRLIDASLARRAAEFEALREATELAVSFNAVPGRSVFENATYSISTSPGRPTISTWDIT